MPFAKLSRLAQERPLRILLVNAGEADAITWAGLVQPLRLAVKLTGTLELDIRTPEQVADAAPGHWHVRCWWPTKRRRRCGPSCAAPWWSAAAPLHSGAA